MGVGAPHFYKPMPTHIVLSQGDPEQTPGYSKVEWPPPLATPSGLYFPSRDGNNKFLPKAKKKSKHKMYFFPELHVPGLTYLTYVIVILFVRTAQRVSGKARNASWGFGPPRVLTPEEGEGTVGVWESGMSLLIPASSPRPHPAHGKGKAALQEEGL